MVMVRKERREETGLVQGKKEIQRVDSFNTLQMQEDGGFDMEVTVSERDAFLKATRELIKSKFEPQKFRKRLYRTYFVPINLCILARVYGK